MRKAIWGIACLSLSLQCFGCGDKSADDTVNERPTVIDAGVDASVIGGRLFPVSDIKDPLDNIIDERQLNDCQVWVDRFQPRDRLASERMVFTFDSASRWTLEEIDIGNDQRINRRRSRRFEGERLTSLETDSDGDGVPDQRIMYQWESGLIIAEDHDQDGDGDYEGRRRLRYNANTWLVADEWVGLPLGDVQSRTIYQYDGEGRQVSAEHTIGVEERLSWTIVSSYDEYGRLTDWQEDRDGDRVFDYRVLYTYDDDARRVIERHDQGSDGTIDGITVTDFDERNRPVLRELDQAGDGTVNERIRFEYLDLKLLRKSIDIDLDGREDQVTIYEYDDLGRVVAKSSDAVVNDDVPPESWSVSYFCP
ncbi:MAG: hypothetical protein ACPGQS_12095 [Bradymonadia bacterium]